MSLVESCKNGDLEGVKAALQSGADVNTKDELSMTGLMWAVSRDTALHCTALHCTALPVRKNHISVVELLLNRPNIDVNLKSECGWSALFAAVKSKNIEALKLLLNVPNIDVNIVNNDGWSALHAAVYSDNDEGLKLLLSHPSLTTLTLNQKERKGCGATPVMFAVMNQRLTGLFALGADPRVDLDTTDEKGRSLEEVARHMDAELTLNIVDEAKKRREERRRLIREQQRQVSKVLLDGLYDSDSPIFKLLGVRTEVMGEIIWQKMLVVNWQIFPGGQKTYFYFHQ